MKIILDEKFNLKSITDDLGEALIKGSNTFDKLYVYVPTSIVDDYQEIAPLYSVRRADGRELGRYATLTNSDTSLSGYTGWYGYFNERDLAVAGALQITISFKLKQSGIEMTKNVSQVTVNVSQGVMLDSDVLIKGAGLDWKSVLSALEALTAQLSGKQDKITNSNRIAGSLVSYLNDVLVTHAGIVNGGDFDSSSQEENEGVSSTASITHNASQIELKAQEEDTLNNNAIALTSVTITKDSFNLVVSDEATSESVELTFDLTNGLQVNGYSVAFEGADLSNFNNDLGFITNTVDDLENYYKKTQTYAKTETYNKTEINDMLSILATGGFVVVQTLPTQNIQNNVIYLVPSEEAATNNNYDEYLYVNNAWEMIGTTKIDLSDYYTKAQVEANFISKDSYLTNNEIDAICN